MTRFARNPVLLVAGVIGISTVLLFVGWWQVDGPGRQSKPTSPPSNGLPVPLYQMDFTLSDHFGNEVGPQNWIGRPSLVFFGFTYCPDVCPTTLSNISGWLDELGDDARLLRTAFITVDPERDTVPTMADYVGNFHAAIVGYTGSSEEIARVAKSFNVKYERVPSNDGYTMNHTTSVFLFNVDGKFVSTIDLHEPPEFAIPKIRRALP